METNRTSFALEVRDYAVNTDAGCLTLKGAPATPSFEIRQQKVQNALSDLSSLFLFSYNLFPLYPFSERPNHSPFTKGHSLDHLPVQKY